MQSTYTLLILLDCFLKVVALVLILVKPKDHTKTKVNYTKFRNPLDNGKTIIGSSCYWNS